MPRELIFPRGDLDRVPRCLGGQEVQHLRSQLAGVFETGWGGAIRVSPPGYSVASL